MKLAQSSERLSFEWLGVSILYVIESAWNLILSLCVMTFNTYIFIAIVVGHVLGHYITPIIESKMKDEAKYRLAQLLLIAYTVASLSYTLVLRDLPGEMSHHIFDDVNVYHGGSGHKKFDWHPTFAILSLFSFFQGVLIRHGIWRFDTKTNLLVHAALMTCGGVFLLTSFIYVVVFTTDKKLPHFEALHTWVGMMVFCAVMIIIPLSWWYLPNWHKEKKYWHIHVIAVHLVLLSMIFSVATGYQLDQTLFTSCTPDCSNKNWNAVLTMLLIPLSYVMFLASKRSKSPSNVVLESVVESNKGMQQQLLSDD